MLDQTAMTWVTERDDEPEFVAVLAPFFVGNRQGAKTIEGM